MIFTINKLTLMPFLEYYETLTLMIKINRPRFNNYILSIIHFEVDTNFGSFPP